jgi:1,4-dihydroxy-2-naphthoyl-CoA hydrolase
MDRMIIDTTDITDITDTTDTTGDGPDPGHAEALGRSMPLAELLGITITAASAEAVEGELAWRPELCTLGGLLHGGALMSFADCLGAVAASLHLPEGATTATVTSHTTFVAAVREATITGRAVVEHAGSRFVTVRTEVRRGDGRLVATVSQTQAVLR